MPVPGDEIPDKPGESWRNIVQNYNYYSDGEWQWINQHMPRKMWGIPVITVSGQSHPAGTHHGRWYRFLAWWSIPGHWSK